MTKQDGYGHLYRLVERGCVFQRGSFQIFQSLNNSLSLNALSAYFLCRVFGSDQLLRRAYGC